MSAPAITRVTTAERQTIRELARKVADIAALPVQHERTNLIRALNDLRPIRPVVLAFPEGGWREIIPDSTLTCTQHLLRQWESHLRGLIFRHEMIGDDYPITNDFNVPWRVQHSGFGLAETRTRSQDTGSYHWDPPIKTRADFDKLHHDTVTIDRQATTAAVTLADDILGDILNVQIHGNLWWTTGLTQTLVHLRGLDQVMFDMYDDPQLLHDMMAFLRDSTIAQLETFQAEGVLCLNNGPNDYVGSGGLGCTAELPAADFSDNVRLKDMWALAESQETVGVGPLQFAEFILPYQQPLMDRFGLVCYGCCEPIDKRLDLLINRVPNLRRLSISPWSDRHLAAQRIGKNYVFSWKPNPSYICSPQPDWDAARKAIEETVDIARNCCLEMIMKDTHTFCNDPSRIGQWARIALEVARNA